MRFLLALGLAAAFAATAPAGFAQTMDNNGSVPTTSQPGFHYEGGAAARQGDYAESAAGRDTVSTMSQPELHLGRSKSATKDQDQRNR